VLQRVTLLLCAIAATLGAPPATRAEDAYPATVTIRDHRFEPAELHVPAGKRILLTCQRRSALRGVRFHGAEG
jgi:hypothetical protein